MNIASIPETRSADSRSHFVNNIDNPASNSSIGIVMEKIPIVKSGRNSYRMTAWAKSSGSEILDNAEYMNSTPSPRRQTNSKN